jgi:hypothetical protein
VQLLAAVILKPGGKVKQALLHISRGEAVALKACWTALCCACAAVLCWAGTGIPRARLQRHLLASVDV